MLLAFGIAVGGVVVRTHTSQPLGPIDLGALADDTSSRASAVNDRGHVIGISPITTGEVHGFLWTQSDGMVDLGTLGGRDTFPFALNERDQVVGVSFTTDGATHAFSWMRLGGIVDLGTLGGDFSTAVAVNNRGQVVGSSRIFTGEEHAFVWTEADGMIDLGTLGGSFSGATGINDHREIVGWSTTSDGETHAVVWTRSGEIVDLGTADGDAYSVGTAINERGLVVGYGVTAFGLSYVLSWSRREAAMALTSPSEIALPSGVNDRGTVVGTRGDPAECCSRKAVTWNQRGEVTEIGTLGGATSSAVAINDHGQVAGISDRQDDANERAFRWSPSIGIQDLGTLPGGFASVAVAINARGDVAGDSVSPVEIHAVLWPAARSSRGRSH